MGLREINRLIDELVDFRDPAGPGGHGDRQPDHAGRQPTSQRHRDHW